MRKPEFVYVTYIETTPEKLWEALTSSEFSKRYWFNTELKSDWKVRSPFALVTAPPPMSGKFSRSTGRGGCPTRSTMYLVKQPARSGRPRLPSISNRTASS